MHNKHCVLSSVLLFYLPAEHTLALSNFICNILVLLLLRQSFEAIYARLLWSNALTQKVLL